MLNRFLLPDKALPKSIPNTEILRLRRNTQTAMATGFLDTMVDPNKPATLTKISGKIFYDFFHNFHRGGWTTIPLGNAYAICFLFSDYSSVIALSPTPLPQNMAYEKATASDIPLQFYPGIFGLDRNAYLLIEADKGAYGRIITLKGFPLEQFHNDVATIAELIPTTPAVIPFHLAHDYNNPIAQWASTKPKKSVIDTMNTLLAGAVFYHDMPLATAVLHGRVLQDNGHVTCVDITTRLTSFTNTATHWSATLSEVLIPVLNAKLSQEDQIAHAPRLGTHTPPRRHALPVARFLPQEWNSAHKISGAIEAFLS